MKIAVLGAGAIGAYVGAALHRAGVEVHLIARGAHLAAMREHGVRVLSPRGDFTARPHAVAVVRRPRRVRVREVGQASVLAFSAWNSSSLMTFAARSCWSFASSSAGDTAAAAFWAASACVIICRSWGVIFGRATM